MVPTFFGMSFQYPQTSSSDNVPNPDHSVVAARNKSTPSRCKGTDGVFMAFKVQLMERVGVNVYLR
jgi:hypothetical protein